MAYWPEYNQVAYNTHAYNFNTTWHIKALVETLTNSDSVIVKSLGKALRETMTPSDTIAKDVEITLQETQFMLDELTKYISEKLLAESVIIQHWLDIKKNQDKSDFTN